MRPEVIDTFKQQLSRPDYLFAETLAFIEQHYHFTPTAFTNGHVENSADQNQGSCKVFALAELLALSKEQALLCFGEHYRDVLATPDIANHQNLRRVLKEGLDAIHFQSFPLVEK